MNGAPVPRSGTPADGYTLLMGTTTLAINPSLRVRLPYDTLNDLEPVTQAAFQAYVLAVHPSVQARDIKEFIALAKARPGTLNYGSPGTRSGSHLAGELFAMLSGVRLMAAKWSGAARKNSARTSAKRSPSGRRS